MTYTHHERLSAADAAFLDLEDANVHMHVGSVAIFEAGPLKKPDGGLDFERIREATRQILHRYPRFGQKIVRTPFFDHPVWVDDPAFNLDYHLRHTSLARPGDVRRLKRLAGRIMSQKLDRQKPLWEFWYVEEVEGDRFAVITKIHHCMFDGVAGRDLMTGLMQRGPRATDPRASWRARPATSGARLFANELSRRASIPGSLVRAGLDAIAHPLETLRAAGELAATGADAARTTLRPASDTPLNLPLGPHRRFDWTQHDLAAVKEIEHEIGGTVNDVVLSIVAGALRRFFERRSIRPDDLDFRVAVPVNVRTQADTGRLGNRVSSLVVPLPLDEPDPRRRLERVTETTRELKQTRQVQAVELVTRLGEFTGTSLYASFARLAAQGRANNMVVTNVPGPTEPAHLLGARMLEIYSLVPLLPNQDLGIAVFSYDGALFWGFNADWDAVQDLHDLVEAVNAEFEALQKAAVGGPHA